MAFKVFDPTIAARKTRNAEIFRETIRTDGYTALSGRKIRFNFTEMLRSGRCYRQEIPAVSAPVLDGDTTVVLEGNDCLVRAGRLLRVPEGIREWRQPVGRPSLFQKTSHHNEL